jgi:hypothetical protein
MRTTSTQQVRQAIYHGSIERGQSYGDQAKCLLATLEVDQGTQDLAAA